MAVVGSTKDIFRSLQVPLARGQVITFSNSEDSDGGRSVNRPTSISGVIEDGRSEDALQLKIKNPKLTPTPKPTLTSDEEKQLDHEFRLAKRTLDKFTDMLRLEGLDPSGCSVSKTHHGRISCYIPPHYSNRFHIFMTNKITFAKQHHDIIPETEPSRRRGMRGNVCS